MTGFRAPLAPRGPLAPVATLAPANNLSEHSLNTFDSLMEAAASFLTIYYTPVLVLLGTVGNLLSVFVFYTSKLRLQSTSAYLSVLALSDTVFLLQLIPPWLNAMQYTSLFHRPGFCQVFVYSSYVTCCLSAWLVVAFTIERFVAVLYPLQRNSMCTLTRAKCIIFLLVMSALVLNIPVIKYAATSINDCNIDIEYMEHAARFNYVDTAISFTLPLIIIVILNGWITIGVCRVEHERRVLIMARQEQPARPGARSPPPALSPQHRVTRMLLIVSTVFVVLNLPAYTMRLLAYAYDMSSSEYSGRWAAMQQLALMFFNTNFGINFILYCLSGQNFRRALCQAIPCLRHRIPREEVIQMMSRNVARVSSVSTSYASAIDGQAAVAGPALGAAAASTCVLPYEVRRHRSEPVIHRWTWNNTRRSRDQLAGPAIEMQALGAGPHLPELM